MIVSSATTDLLIQFFPFLLFWVVFVVARRKARDRPNPALAPLLEKLDEIRDEIRRLRKSVEERESVYR